VVLALSPFTALSAPTTFSDGTFIDADWSVAFVFDDTASRPATFTVNQVGTGGNPGAYRFETHRMDQGNLHVVSLHSGFLYDPAVSGAISAIDFSYDLTHPSTYSGSYWPVLAQNGTYYAPQAGDVAPLGGAWTHFGHNDLDALDFTRQFGSGAVTPDFSSSGAPMQFGYFFANTHVSGVGNFFSYSSGIDNFQVTIVPEPSTWALLLLGGATLALAARKRSL